MIFDKTSQCAYNSVAHSPNHFCRGKEVSIKYYECVCLLSCLSHPAFKAHTPYYFVICDLSGSTIFFTLSYRRHDFREELLNIKSVLIFGVNFCLEHFILWEETSDMLLQMCRNLHVNCLLSLSDFTENWIFRQIFEKYSNIKFHENRSNGSRAVPCRQTDGQSWRS